MDNLLILLFYLTLFITMLLVAEGFVFLYTYKPKKKVRYYVDL